MEWDYSGRKGRDEQKKKIDKANERKGEVKKNKRWRSKWTRGKGEGAPAPHRATNADKQNKSENDMLHFECH